MYRWYYDDTPKRTTADKAANAIETYTQREGTRPNVLWLWFDADMPDTFAGCKVERKTHITLNNMWVGYDATN